MPARYAAHALTSVPLKSIYTNNSTPGAAKIVLKGLLPSSKKIGMKLAGMVLKRPWLYRISGKIARFVLPKLPRFMVYHGLNSWGKQREIPTAPKQSFREQFQQRKQKQ